MSEIPRSEQIEGDPKVEIKEYSDEYKEQVKDLISDIYENELGWHSKSKRPDLEKIHEIYQRENGNFWVALKNGRVIGTISLLDVGDERATLHRFCVEKKFRGQDKGVSSGLFSNLLDFAKEKKLKKIFLATHEQAEGAIKFYDKNGFKQITFESLPEDIASQSYMGKDDLIYELDLEEKKEEK
jgi:N-acetylglutamate synthase-like GNAT family acetyltransferase